MAKGEVDRKTERNIYREREGGKMKRDRQNQNSLKDIAVIVKLISFSISTFTRNSIRYS